MSSLDVTRAELVLAVLYLNKAETRDKICRSILYGSRFLGNGEPGTAQNVEKSVILARNVFRLFKNGQYKSKVQESKERSLAFVKAALDIVVAVGLLRLAPKKVTPRPSCLTCRRIRELSHLLLSGSCFHRHRRRRQPERWPNFVSGQNIHVYYGLLNDNTVH